MYYPKLQVLIDHLKSVENNDFNIEYINHSGPCCVGGHAKRILSSDENSYSGVHFTCCDALDKLCGLPYKIAYNIAFAYPEWLIRSPISKDIAVRMLENLRDTGEINWYV